MSYYTINEEAARTANDGHPTVSGHKYIGRQILKAVNY